MNHLTKYGADETVFGQASEYPNLALARVISQTKNLYRIVTERGEGLGEVSGKFRHEVRALSQFPAVGDYVMVDEGGAGGGNAVIHQVLRRKSAFERAAVGQTGQMQVVAANVDIVFVCMALNHDYNLSRLERYLSVVWDSGATPAVVLTKSDLCSDLENALFEISGVAVGVDVFTTSSHDEASFAQLLPHLGPGVTASFVGSSGVGKSTLVNRLLGEEAIATAATRRDDKGRHTTTRRELLVLPNGGVVIDTPGMRELGADAVDLSKSFADIHELAARCKFSDCTHTAEPGCAVQAAVEVGQLDRRRLDSYQKLQKEARYDGLSSKQIEAEKLKTMLGSFGSAKNARNYIRNMDKNRR